MRASNSGWLTLPKEVLFSSSPWAEVGETTTVLARTGAAQGRGAELAPADEAVCGQRQLLHLAVLLVGHILHRLLRAEAGPRGGPITLPLLFVLPGLEGAFKGLQGNTQGAALLRKQSTWRGFSPGWWPGTLGAGGPGPSAHTHAKPLACLPAKKIPKGVPQNSALCS